jgi:hypothetical protein
VIVCFHYFLCLPDDAPPPTSSSSSPGRRSAALHRRAPVRPEATEVRTSFLPSCGRHGVRAEVERPPLHAATPPLVMPAIELGWDAISCRCRRLHQHARAARLAYPSSRRMPPCFGRRRAVSARSRRVCVACAFARASVRAATLSRKRAPQHACAVTLKARPGLWSIFVPTASLAAVPRKAAPP